MMPVSIGGWILRLQITTFYCIESPLADREQYLRALV
jgi:hypothetical protein